MLFKKGDKILTSQELEALESECKIVTSFRRSFKIVQLLTFNKLVVLFNDNSDEMDYMSFETAYPDWKPVKEDAVQDIVYIETTFSPGKLENCDVTELEKQIMEFGVDENRRSARARVSPQLLVNAQLERRINELTKQVDKLNKQITEHKHTYEHVICGNIPQKGYTSVGIDYSDDEDDDEDDD